MNIWEGAEAGDHKGGRTSVLKGPRGGKDQGAEIACDRVDQQNERSRNRKGEETGGVCGGKILRMSKKCQDKSHVLNSRKLVPSR